MLRIFWEGHDPTQGMRQGNDLGTQYRSLLMWRRRGPAGRRRSLPGCLPGATDRGRGYGTITTEILPADAEHPFYYAEAYHQQYLAKNPGGYCGLGGTGVACPVGVGRLQRAHLRGRRTRRIVTPAARVDDRRRPLAVPPRRPWGCSSEWPC